ncbi:MAG: hypothetical protein ABI891_13400 [Acidobacteriota bacterium]
MTQQRPPLSVNPNEDCHIADAVPLLMKKDYISVGYKLMKLQNKPLTIEEKISVDKFVDLKIEQRGCEDIYAKFNFTFKEKRNRGIKYNLSKAAQLLKNLKINSDTLLSSKTLDRIADLAFKESKKAKPSKEQLICLSKIEGECFTDVSVKYKYPNLQIFYVDRP